MTPETPTTAEEQWEGVEGSGCEHRTLGRRAWCHSCSEYCSPGSLCVREELTRVEAENASLQSRVRELEEGLRNIEKAEGRYSRDPLTHASNTIEDMQAIARALLPEGEGQ